MHIRNAVVGLFVFLAAAMAQADNTSCNGATFVVPDGSTHEGDLSGANQRWYRFVAKAGRSYAIMLENLTAGDEQAEIGALGVFDACGGALVPTNDTADFQEPVGTRGANGEPGLAAGATRQALVASANGELFFNVGDLDTSNAARFRVRVEETTLFNPLWSTDDGFSTHYRLYNTTNRACSVTLDLRTDNNGAPVGGPSTVTFTLAANSSVSRRTGPADLNVKAGQVGHATIAHTCTPGAILADAFLSHPGGRMLPLKVTTARQQR